MNAVVVREGQAEAVDDVSGESLRPDLVKEARMLEMKYFHDMRVYDHVPRSSIAATGGKLIGMRWIDINKGVRRTPNTGQGS